MYIYDIERYRYRYIEAQHGATWRPNSPTSPESEAANYYVYTYVYIYIYMYLYIYIYI